MSRVFKTELPDFALAPLDHDIMRKFKNLA